MINSYAVYFYCSYTGQAHQSFIKQSCWYEAIYLFLVFGTTYITPPPPPPTHNHNKSKKKTIGLLNIHYTISKDTRFDSFHKITIFRWRWWSCNFSFPCPSLILRKVHVQLISQSF